MKKMVMTLLVVIVIVGAFTFGALNYHFILMDSSIKLLKKVDLTFENTFVDARGSKRYKLYTNPALIKAGVKDLIEEKSVTIGK
jgi:hypothetical protein